MKIYRVYEKEILENGNYNTVNETFYSLEKLVEYLNKNKAYYKFINEPISQESVVGNITDSYCVDVIIPASREQSVWDLCGIKQKDTLLWIVELNYIK